MRCKFPSSRARTNSTYKQCANTNYTADAQLLPLAIDYVLGKIYGTHGGGVEFTSGMTADRVTYNVKSLEDIVPPFGNIGIFVEQTTISYVAPL